MWLDIPEDCRVSGEITADYDAHIVFGGLRDGVEMQIQRPALERFVQVATELLARQIPANVSEGRHRLHASSG
ncbi:hypothetical protein [Actinophytocola glycyrrhizae]|uniref:Uncharacterized protein n=1 Tax=Actinophytocola glycyrrhizae TaxID=2044873 RepID=A0ABV9SFL9_9PSEU